MVSLSAEDEELFGRRIFIGSLSENMSLGWVELYLP